MPDNYALQDGCWNCPHAFPRFGIDATKFCELRNRAVALHGICDRHPTRAGKISRQEAALDKVKEKAHE